MARLLGDNDYNHTQGGIVTLFMKSVLIISTKRVKGDL